VLGGTDCGDVVRWDVRRPSAAAQRVRGLHSGPVAGVVSTPAGDVFSAGEDGAVRGLRCGALGPRRESRFRAGGGVAWLTAADANLGAESGGIDATTGAAVAAPVLLAGAGRLSGVVWLQSGEQRRGDVRGEGLVLAACERGDVVFACATAGAGAGAGEDAGDGGADEDEGEGDYGGELGEDEGGEEDDH
jgi:hypothetical protein